MWFDLTWFDLRPPQLEKHFCSNKWAWDFNKVVIITITITIVIVIVIVIINVIVITIIIVIVMVMIITIFIIITIIITIAIVIVIVNVIIIKWSYDPRSYERNSCNCVKKPEQFRTSTGFESVTSRYRCDALTNWAMKPLTLGAGHLWVPMFPWGMNQWWNDIWNGPYMNCGNEIKRSYDPRSYESIFSIA